MSDEQAYRVDVSLTIREDGVYFGGAVSEKEFSITAPIYVLRQLDINTSAGQLYAAAMVDLINLPDTEVAD